MMGIKLWLCSDWWSLEVLRLVLAHGSWMALVVMGLMRNGLIVLVLRWRNGGNTRRVSGGRRGSSWGRWIGGHPVNSLVKHLLESAHIKLVGDTASWARPERRLMVIRPLVRVGQRDRGRTWCKAR